MNETIKVEATMGPLEWWRNPIFQRELVTFLRSPRAFAYLAVYVFIPAVIMTCAWPHDSGGSVLRGDLSRQLFALFSMAQTLLLVLLIPAALGNAMTMEKEGGTHDLLLTTPLTGRRILLGKLLSGLSYFLLLAVVSLPVLMLCYVIGGLAVDDVLGLAVLFVAQVVVFGLTSISCSAYFHKTYMSVIIAYAFVSLEAVVFGSVYGDGIGFFLSADMNSMLVGVGALSVALFQFAAWAVRQPYTPAQKTLEDEEVDRPFTMVLRRDSYPDKWLLPARRTGPLPDGVNPVIDKELQSGIYGGGSQFARWIILAGMGMSLFAFFLTMARAVQAESYTRLQREGEFFPEYSYFAYILGYIMMIGPALGARLFTLEKEEGTLESLLLTPLPVRSIVFGKLWAVLRVVTTLALMNCMLFVILVFLSSYAFFQLITMLLVILSVTPLVAALGLFMSVRCKTTLSAMLCTYLTLFLLYLCPLFVVDYLVLVFPWIQGPWLASLDVISPFLAVRMPALGNGAQLINLLLHATFSLSMATALVAYMNRRLGEILLKQFEELG